MGKVVIKDPREFISKQNSRYLGVDFETIIERVESIIVERMEILTGGYVGFDKHECEIFDIGKIVKHVLSKYNLPKEIIDEVFLDITYRVKADFKDRGYDIEITYLDDKGYNADIKINWGYYYKDIIKESLLDRVKNVFTETNYTKDITRNVVMRNDYHSYSTKTITYKTDGDEDSAQSN